MTLDSRLFPTHIDAINTVLKAIIPLNHASYIDMGECHISMGSLTLSLDNEDFVEIYWNSTFESWLVRPLSATEK